MKKARLCYAFSALFLVLFMLLVSLLLTTDLRDTGLLESRIGLGGINLWARDAIGESHGWYLLSEVLGVLGILLAACFAALGLWQAIRRRSLRAVDKPLLCLGGLYIVLCAAYLLFELFVVNYRPVPEDGTLAPSFPSSHTLLALVIYCSAAVLFGRISHKTSRRIAVFSALGLSLLLVVARTASGVHWLTDILGALLLGGALVLCFVGTLRLFDARTSGAAMPSPEE